MPRKAARPAIMATCVAALGSVATQAQADEPPRLFLAPHEAMELLDARPVEPPPEESPPSPDELAARVAPAPGPNIVPPRFHIPDGYELDFDRDPPRFAAPVDRDNLVSFELYDDGLGVFLDYEEESMPIGETEEVFLLQIERRF